MKILIRLSIINLLLLVTFSSCNNDTLKADISSLDLSLEIQRFDQALFTIDFDSVEQAVTTFCGEYGDFFDVFNVHVINIGPASQKYYASYLSMFVNDPLNYEVYEYTQEVFSDLLDIEDELSDAFKRYMYHFPEWDVPELIAYVSRFNHKLFTVENYIGIGLDQYLGRDCPYYDMLGTAEYMQYNMHPVKLVPDVVQVWGSSKFAYNDSLDNVLSRMVYNGKIMYFTDALLPDIGDSLKIGFSPSQMEFCENNEKQMWTYLIEHKMLFSTDELEIRKLTDDAPTTYYFPDESPGKAAVWLGWQIVKEYARKNPGLSVQDIMLEDDYQKILRGSRYNP